MKYVRKNLDGFPGYAIDTNGDAWSRIKQRPINKGGKIGCYGTESYLSTEWKKLKAGNDGRYFHGRFCNKNTSISKSLHRLVAIAFIPNPENKPCVCHKDGNGFNNHVENLYWGTAKENEADKLQHGTRARGGANGSSKLNDTDIPLIRELLVNSFMTLKRIGELFGVSLYTISLIKLGKTWRHIP